MGGSEASSSSSSWKMTVCAALTLAYRRVSESGLEYLFILGKKSLTGTLKHHLQISEGLSQGRRIRFVFWHPKGKIDMRMVILREVKMVTCSYGAGLS